jgi:hypothetical protein
MELIAAGPLRPNGSLGIVGKNNTQHSTVGAALRSSPSSEGAVS